MKQQLKGMAYEKISKFYKFLNLFPEESHTRILMYHSISNNDKTGEDIYSISLAKFISHLDVISNKNLSVLSFSEAMFSQRGIIFTFDDGYKDNLHLVAPLFLKRNWPFTVFITPKYVDSDDSIYLTTEELKLLSSYKGVTIGAHGFSHCRLADCKSEKIKEEIVTSKHWIEDKIGKEVEFMSYPHGSVNRRVIDLVKEAGYKYAASSRFGKIGENSNPYCLPRTDIWNTDREKKFLSKLNGDWDWMQWV